MFSLSKFHRTITGGKNERISVGKKDMRRISRRVGKNYPWTPRIKSERAGRSHRHSTINALCYRAWQNQFGNWTRKNIGKSPQMPPGGTCFSRMGYWSRCIILLHSWMLGFIRQPNLAKSYCCWLENKLGLRTLKSELSSAHFYWKALHLQPLWQFE